MKNEIGKRIQGDLLYEPPEPLFPEGFPKRRKRVARFLALIVLFALAVCVWVISASGKSGDGVGSFDESGPSGETVTGSVESTVGEHYESEYESEYADMSTEGERHPPETELAEIESREQTEAVSETEEIESGTADVIEVDLSQIEKGAGYVINYSDKIADVGGLIDRGFIDTVERGGAAPLVLVIHTHTSEEYLSGGSGYRGPSSVVSVGDVLNARLNSLGIGSVHCTVIHDSGAENAYKNARQTIETMLEIYPSIRYIIDLHRMELESGGTLMKTVSGCSDGSAQIRVTVGSHGTDDSWQEDLSLALSLRGSLNDGGARICMPVVISPGMPNSDMGRYYITVDIGSSGNTVEEAMAAGERLAFAIGDVVAE